MANPFRNSIKGDKIIWFVIGILSLISIIAIFSSTGSLAYRQGQGAFSYLFRQTMFVLIGLAILYAVHNVPIGWFRRMAHPALYISIALLLALFVFGVTLNEGTRWIRIFGFTFQPSDVAKIGLVLYLAKVLEEGTVTSFREFALRIMLPVSVVCGLILWSGTSTALLLGGTCFLILFIGGIKPSYLMRFAGLGMIAVVLVIALGLTPRAETVRSRLVTFVSSNSEGESAERNKKEDARTFQADQAKIAIATGGLTGKGPGNSTQRHIVPHPYSDFIFAIIVEEYGIMGAIVVVFLYWILLYRAIAIARSCTRIFPMITVLGIMLLLVLQAMVNMAVAVGLFPVTGQTLPLISLGGSSLFATSLALGIILSVSRATEERDMPATQMENGKLKMENEAAAAN